MTSWHRDDIISALGKSNFSKHTTHTYNKQMITKYDTAAASWWLIGAARGENVLCYRPHTGEREEICLFVEIRRIYRHQGICGHSSECRVETGDWRPPLRWRLGTSGEMMRGLLLSAAAPSISREWSFLRCRVEMSLGWGRAGDIMTECTINIALILHCWLLHRHRCDS